MKGGSEDVTSAHEILVLGAGVAGMTAASRLGDRAVVLERSQRPGGLVRTEHRSGYWFDRVLHLLYFSDLETKDRTCSLVGEDLQRCEAQAWVVTTEGTTRFPLQMHLRGLNRGATVRCVADLLRASVRPRETPANFEEALLATFGKSMCEIFLFPYNQKVWKRPLNSMAATGLWTITKPDLRPVLLGAIMAKPGFVPYNADGWYPRPRPEVRVRGMEVLSQALASRVRDLRLRHTIQSVDLEKRIVTAASPEGPRAFQYERLCSTIPLPRLLEMCKGVPQLLLKCSTELLYNRVLSVFVSVRGTRPTRTGHWHYYSDESLVFTRVVFMHEFDPEMAPRDGWGLLVEVTERAEGPSFDRESLTLRVAADLRRAELIPPGTEIVDMAIQTIDPAYVVFTAETQRTVLAAIEFLREHRVDVVGRFGRWEYSSMSQVMQQGHMWAEALAQSDLERACP